MARIRTVKPEFFTHWELYDLEIETGYPIRVAFSGLWTQADREGRFQWIPQQLKLGCLPYDEIDFSRVLHALATRDFIRKYVVDGREYGYIPGFSSHQVINNRESESKLPEPNENNTLTREARVNDAWSTREVHAQAEGKGKEGRERKGKETDMSGKPDDAPKLEIQILDYLNHVTGKNFKPVESNLKLIRARLSEKHTPEEITAVIDLKNRQWSGTKQDEYLRPATLFGAEKFNQYVGEIGRQEKNDFLDWLNGQEKIVEGEVIEH